MHSVTPARVPRGHATIPSLYKRYIAILLHLVFSHISASTSLSFWDGRSGGAMVLGNLPVPGHPTIRMTVGQGPNALAVGAGGFV